MILNDMEIAAGKLVIDRFLDSGETTPRKHLVARFKNPGLVDMLVKKLVLTSFAGPVDGLLLPLVLAFEYCADDETRFFAKRSLSIVLNTLLNLYGKEGDKPDFSTSEVEAEAEKIYGSNVTARAIKLGLYLVKEFNVCGASGTLTEVARVTINENIFAIPNLDTAWDEYVARVKDMLPLSETPKDREVPPAERPTEIRSSDKSDLLILISHSSQDAELADAVVQLVVHALRLRTGQIRCTSVDGYRLPVGVNSESKLREEVNAAAVVIGLITPNSLASAFAMFELGARWGAKLFLAPVLAGVMPQKLRGPLALLNALTAESESQIHQLLADIAKELEMQLEPTSSYVRYIANVKKLAEAVQNAEPQFVPAGEMIFEEGVRWKFKDGEREGPYCPNCFEDKEKEIHLIAGATKGTFHCGVCKQGGFRTAEYNTNSGVRRRPYGGPQGWMR